VTTLTGRNKAPSARTNGTVKRLRDRQRANNPALPGLIFFLGNLSVDFVNQFFGKYLSLRVCRDGYGDPRLVFARANMHSIFSRRVFYPLDSILRV